MRVDAEAARRFFETVLATDAANGPAHFYAGYIAWKSNNAMVARQEFRRAAPTAGASMAAVPGEGDTKRGSTPLDADQGRCDEFRAPSRGIQPNDDEREMAKRYAALGRLLRSAHER
jgi:hypothetical protein